jgi:DNA-binding CsgD family transcriptional regulator
MDVSVLSFIESAAGAEDVAALNAAFRKAMREYGIGLFAAAVLDPVSMRPEHFLASNYPSQWIEHYTSQGYDRVDPVVLSSRTAESAFVWTEPQAPRPARQLFDEAAGAGIVSGFAVPVRLRNGQRSVVSVTSDQGAAAFGRLMRWAGPSIQTAIYCYHDALCDLTGLGTHRPGAVSGLEAEVLRWMGAGKGMAEIADLLCMPECSVRRHVANVMDHLGVTTPEHLAAEALRRGFVT